MKQLVVIVVALVLSALFPPAALAAPALPDKDTKVNTGFASKATSVDDPMRMVVTIKDPNDPSKLIKKDVAVTDIPKYVRPTPNVGETPRAFFMRVIAAQEAHSKLKAERIAAAINGVLGAGTANVTQVNTLAGTGSPLWNVLVPGDAAVTPIRNGLITITGAHNITYGFTPELKKVRDQDIKDAKAHNAKPENKNNQIPVPKPLSTNHTGEVGDGVQVVPGKPVIPPPGSSRYRTSMGTTNLDLDAEFPGEFPGLPMIATGLDSDGNPSVFQYGILDRYVATLNPVPGQTDEQLYLELASLLNSHGLPATYDSLTRTLSLDEDFGDDDTMYWANNDTGFADYLTVAYGEVPEPAALSLVALTLVGMLHRTRRYDKTKAAVA